MEKLYGENPYGYKVRSELRFLQIIFQNELKIKALVVMSYNADFFIRFTYAYYIGQEFFDRIIFENVCTFLTILTRFSSIHS